MASTTLASPSMATTSQRATAMGPRVIRGGRPAAACAQPLGLTLISYIGHGHTGLRAFSQLAGSCCPSLVS
jgi:hypothetical protein